MSGLLSNEFKKFNHEFYIIFININIFSIIGDRMN